MRSDQLESCPPLKRGRRFNCAFLNYLLLGIFATVLSLLGNSIYSITPSGTSLFSSLNSDAADLTTLVISSHLGEKDDDGNLKSENSLVSTYVYSLAKASLLYNGVPESELSSAYKGIASADSNSDRLYYYYDSFYSSHASSFSTSPKLSLDTYVSSLKEGHESLFEEGLSYPYLNKAAAKDLDEGLQNASYEKGNEIKSYLTSRYLTLLSNAINEFESIYTPYLNLSKTYEAKIQNYILIRGLICLSMCVLASLISYIVLPLVLKNHCLLADKAFQAPFRSCGNKEKLTYPLSIIASVLLSPLLYPLALILSSGTAGLEILVASKIGNFPLYWLFFIAFFLEGANLLTSFFTPRKTTALQTLFGIEQVDARIQFKKKEEKKDGK